MKLTDDKLLILLMLGSAVFVLILVAALLIRIGTRC